MISRIIKVEGGVITRTRRLRLITITETVIYYQVKKSSIHGLSSGIFRDGPLEKWWGVGNFQLGRIFFSLTACAGIFFFRWTPLHEFFFFRQILLFFEQWNLDSLSMFLCFINYSTLTTDQRIQATFRKCTHSERGGSHLEWTASLCRITLPSGIPLPQPIIMMPVRNKRWQAKHDS